MRITVKLFAILREKAGLQQLDLELNDGATVSDAAGLLAHRIDSIAKYLDRVAFAVNREYVPKSTALSDGDELAIIPPVSGG